MTQYQGSDIAEVLFIDEGDSNFGTNPTSGAYLNFGVPTGFEANPEYVILRQRGLGHQKPTAFHLVKENWRARVEANVAKYDADPAYNIKALLDAALNIDGSNNPTDQPQWVSVGCKLDLDTDEFYVLNGGAIETVEIRGDSIDDRIKVSCDIIFQRGDYGEVDYIGGTATRTAAVVEGELLFGDCDVLWGADGSEATILSRLNSWSIRFRRQMRKQGTRAAATKEYREFVCVQQDIEVTLGIDFDSKTEYEYFIDQTGFSTIVKVQAATNGVQLDMDGGKFVSSSLPIRELDLLNVTLQAEHTQLTMTDIA